MLTKKKNCDDFYCRLKFSHICETLRLLTQRHNVQQQQQLPAGLEPLSSSWTATQCFHWPSPSWTNTHNARGLWLYSHRKLPISVPYPRDSRPHVDTLIMCHRRSHCPRVGGQLAALRPLHHALGQSRHTAFHGSEHDVAVPSCIHHAHVSLDYLCCCWC